MALSHFMIQRVSTTHVIRQLLFNDWNLLKGFSLFRLINKKKESVTPEVI